MEKQIQATIISIQLESQSYVLKPFPKTLHGLCYHLSGGDYPHNKYVPPKFHPVIKKWITGQWGTKATISISSICEELTNRIFYSLASNDTLLFGTKELKVSKVSIDKQELILLDKIHAKPVPDEFKINFTLPTQFRGREPEKYITKAYPDVTLFIRSAARNLHLLYGFQISLIEQDELINNISLIDANAFPMKVQVARNEPFEDYFIGDLHLDCRALTTQQKKLFGLLLKTVKYTGIGHHKGFGFGHIEIKRPMLN